MNYLGKTSKRRIKDINEYLKLVLATYFKLTDVDITIPWMGGKRTDVQQNNIFLKGYSKADGYIKLSYHQSGNAVDAAPYRNGGISKDRNDVLTVVKYMIDAFNELKLQGLISDDLYLHSGLFWGDKDLDGDGFLTEQDKFGWDSRHFELRTKPQLNTYEIKLAT